MTDDDALDALLTDPATVLRTLNRIAARDSLLEFAGLIDIPGAPVEADADNDDAVVERVRLPQADHHRLLIRSLEAVERGEIRHLMVFMPPGSAKSTYASVVFPAWFMGRAHRRNVMVATYASDLGRKIGRRMRSIVRQPVYEEVFATSLSGEVGAADEWALTNESEIMTGGILSGMTGNRADLLVIDDPIKGRAEADSDVIRERTWQEYQDSLLTRLKPGGRVVLIQTRWHEDDLAGRILPETWDGQSGDILCRDGQTWRVLCIPAEADRPDDPLGRQPGQMLWPEWFDAQHWSRYRANPRTWAALYQQRPKPDEGSFFLRSWFRRWSSEDPRPDGAWPLPKALRVYGTSDYAVTEAGGDWTVLRVWGIDHDGNIYLLDGWRGQTASDQWIEAQCDLVATWRPQAFLGEAGVIQKAVEPMLSRRLRERGLACRFEWLPSINDKASRARGFQDRAARGKVFLPDNVAGDFVLAEYAAFPAGRHDDEVDCASLMGRWLDQLLPARPTHRPAVADMGSVF